MSIINVGATPGTFLTFLTLVALAIAVLSTTFIKPIFFVKITPSDVTDSRFLTIGLWGTCFQDSGAAPLVCTSPRFGYTFDRSRLNINIPDKVIIPTISSALGYLTVVHVLAMVTLIITLVLGLVAHIRAEKLLIGISSQISILSAGLLLFSFIVDFLMFNNGVKNIVDTINANGDAYRSTFGIAYWLVLISLIISAIAAVAFFLGRQYIIRKNLAIEDESLDDITNTTVVSDPTDRYDLYKKTSQQQPTYAIENLNNNIINNDYGYQDNKRTSDNYPVGDDEFAYDNIRKPYPPNYLQPQQPINPETVEYPQQNKHNSDPYSLNEIYSPYQNSSHPPHNNNGFNNPPQIDRLNPSQSSSSYYPFSQSQNLQHPPSSPPPQQFPPPQLPLHSKPTPAPSPAPITSQPQQFSQQDPISPTQSSLQQYQKSNQQPNFLAPASTASTSSNSSNSSLYQQQTMSPSYQKKPAQQIPPPGHPYTPPQPSNQLPFGAVSSSYNSSASPRPGYTTPPQPSNQLPFGTASSSYNSPTSPRPGYTTPPQIPSKIPFGAASSFNSSVSPRPGYTTPPQPSSQLPFGAASSSFNSSLLPRPQQQPFNSGNTSHNYQQQNPGMRQQQPRQQQDLRMKQQRLPPQQQQQRPGLQQQQQQQRTRGIPKQQPTNRSNKQQGGPRGGEGDDNQQQEGDDQQQQEGDQEVEYQTEDQGTQDSYYDSNQDGGNNDYYEQTDYSGGDDVPQQYYDDSSQYQQEDQFQQQDNNDYYQQPQDGYYYQQQQDIQTQNDYNQPQDLYQPQDNSYQQDVQTQNDYNQPQDLYQPQDMYESQDMYNQDNSSYQPQDDSYQQDIYEPQNMYQPEDNSYQEQSFGYNQQENPDQSGFSSAPNNNPPVSEYFSNIKDNGPSGLFNQIKNPATQISKFFK